MTTHKPASYSLNWAIEVVEQAVGKHTRGWNYVCVILRLSRRDLALYLAKGDPLWNNLRSIARLLDNIATGRYGALTMDTLTANVMAYARQNGLDRVICRLTNENSSTIPKKQVYGRDGEGFLPDPSQPFVLEDGLVQFTLFSII